jgi:hypothetical protein
MYGPVGFRRRSRSPLWCYSGNRDVTVDDFGACGSRVLIVEKMNTDTHVTYGVDVIFVNWIKAVWVPRSQQLRYQQVAVKKTLSHRLTVRLFRL